MPQHPSKWRTRLTINRISLLDLTPAARRHRHVIRFNPSTAAAAAAMQATRGSSGSGALGLAGGGSHHGGGSAGGAGEKASESQHMLVVDITSLAEADEEGPARRHTKIVARHLQVRKKEERRPPTPSPRSPRSPFTYSMFHSIQIKI